MEELPEDIQGEDYPLVPDDLSKELPHDTNLFPENNTGQSSSFLLDKKSESEPKTETRSSRCSLRSTIRPPDRLM